MKYFIASDIHGSEKYCKLMIECFIKSKCDKLILLGDILYHGPRNDLPDGYNPKGVIKILNEFCEKIICVKGNCEAEVDQMVLDFPVLCENGNLCLNGKNIYLTHGHHLDELKLCENDTVFFGHTHIPLFEKKDGVLYINPGSVSIPKENSYHSCIILEDNEIEFLNIETKEVYKTEKI